MKQLLFLTLFFKHSYNPDKTMLTSFLKSLEDSNRPLFGPNYWLLNKTGLILPDNTLERIFYILIHEIATFFVITQYVELYVIRSDLDLVLTNLKISMLSIVCVVKANTFVIWQKNWRQVIDYINKADKFEREYQDETKGKIINSYTKYCRRVTYFYWGLVFTTVITVTTTPLMKWYSSSAFREGIKNGTEAFPHIFSSWMPIDKEHSPGSWITVFWHIGICAYGSTIMAAYDTSAIVILVYFGGKLDLLRIRCKEMLGAIGEVISNKDADAAVRQLHEIHVQLLKHSRLFNSVLSPVMFVYMVMCSLMICASAFQLTSATSKAQKLLMAEYLIFSIAQLFMFCWHSNDVIQKNFNVMMGPYESNWWTAGLQQSKSVLLLQGQLQIMHIYTAGPFTNLTLSTFVSYVRGSRAFRQFKNPPQPHMCIQDTLRETSEKLFINVLGWQKIANPKQYSDPIPLYGGMQVPQGCGPNSTRPPLLVFAVMVNPDILKANGKNAANPSDREALVSLLCDFVEAMNPGLVLARNPAILKDRDLAGELKDVWLAVQNKREREKGMSQDVMYKVYDIDGIGGEEPPEEDKRDKKPVKSSKQILLNAGQKSEFDSGMNNCQINQNHLNSTDNTTYCTPVYGQIVSTRENHNQINDIQQKLSSNETKPSTSFRKDWNTVHGKTPEGWDEFSKRNISTLKCGEDAKNNKEDKSKVNGKGHYDFFPVFDNKTDEEATAPDTKEVRSDDSKMIIDSMQKLVLRTTDNKICDNNPSALSSLSS
ncbi:hypothetical protein MSG28_007234 [Choristoneura fumiferana]|uniref:Uncharacterized protein n=1 Tax=Choristoneura fumiferana TaxID=7141 RepID=A0ACC0JWI3_CHOFU|nr:hypothetical protein MSG28_007234 [Choristoneura fumiferana]